MARSLVVHIVGDSKSLERAMSRSSKATKNFNRDVSRQMSGTLRVTRSLTGALTGLGAGIVGLAGAGALIRAGFSEMAEAQKATAQTAAVLSSTAGIANVTAREVEGLAGELMKLSGVDDEVIQSGENMLLTFREIRNEAGAGNDIFTQATRAALDLSVALGTDMTSASKQLGKALQDPVRGITALRRMGITFTAAQLKMVKSLVATGRILDAQKLILAEVRTEVGGSAAALGDTLPGKVNILKETLSNLGGTIAKELTPEITAVVDQFTKWLENPQNQKRVIDDITGALKAMGEVAKATADAIKGIKGAIDTIGGGLESSKLGFLNKGLLENLRSVHAFGTGREWHNEGEKAGTSYTLGFNTAVKEHLSQVNQTLDKQLGRTRRRGRDTTTATAAGPKGVSAGQRNQWFDANISRQLNRLQDLGLRQQLKRLRTIAQEVRARLAVTKDATRRLTLEDRLLEIYRQQKSVQEEITGNIKAANEALKERADAIKQAILDRLQARQEGIENKRELRDAKERLRIARQLGTAQGIRTARENLQSVQAQGLQARIQNAPVTLTKGGQLNVGQMVTINIHGVTDPAEVARRVDNILKKRRRRTGAGGQARPTNAAA